MAARKSKNQINLLPRKGLESTTAGRVLAWILSTFRIIVIVTELIVMIAFLSRFWFDAQNTNLNEEIAQKQAVLAAAQNFEKEFKDTQKRLRTFSELTVDEGLATESLGTISSFLPADVLLTSITFATKGVNIQGITPNELAIQQLLTNLTSAELFSDVQLKEIKTAGANTALLEFGINAVMKK